MPLQRRRRRVLHLLGGRVDARAHRLERRSVELLAGNALAEVLARLEHARLRVARALAKLLERGADLALLSRASCRAARRACAARSCRRCRHRARHPTCGSRDRRRTAPLALPVVATEAAGPKPPPPHGPPAKARCPNRRRKTSPFTSATTPTIPAATAIEQIAIAVILLGKSACRDALEGRGVAMPRGKES